MEYNGVQVVTTKKLAAMFGTTSVRINQNFVKRKHQYELGHHYFVCSGEKLDELKCLFSDKIDLKHTSVLYLWTKYGAYLQAQNLKGDQAWKGFCSCIDYFYGTEELIKTYINELNQKIEQLKQNINERIESK
ncbi:ORF6N domain-containing protein [Ureibacillus composti]